MGRARSERQGARRRLLVGLAVALLLHVAFLGLVFEQKGPGWAPANVITIELRNLPAPTRSTRPPVLVAARRRVRRLPASRPRARAKRAGASLRPEARVSNQAGGSGSGAGGVASLGPWRVRAAQTHHETAPVDLKRSRQATSLSKIDLFPQAALVAGKARWRAAHGGGGGGGLGGQAAGGIGHHRGAGHGTGVGAGDGPAAERARVGRRIARDIADAEAASRVRDGLFDPYFVGLEHAIRRGFHPTVGMLGGADGQGLVPGIVNMAKSWGAAGGQWARSGSPFPDGKKPAGLVTRHEVERAPGGTSGFDPIDFMNRWNDGEFETPGGAVIVELTQDAGGKPLRATIVHTSGNDLLDRAALMAVESAAAKRIAPMHGLGLGGPTIRSRWKVEAHFVTNTAALPPDPTGGLGGGFINHGSGILPGLMAGGTFDDSTGEVTINTPGKTKVLTRVTLLAVYGGETRPHPG